VAKQNDRRESISLKKAGTFLGLSLDSKGGVHKI